MTDNLKERAVTGVGWLGIAQVGGQVLKFVVSAILARILTAEEFGLIGMVLVFSGFARLFNEMGFSAALIQKPRVRERDWSSVFWLNLTAGFLMMLLFIVLAPLLAWFFEKPELTPIAMLMSLDFLIGSLVIVHRARFTRAMDFRTLAIAEVIAVAVSGMIGIAMALTGFGVFALVGQVLFMSTCLTVLIWHASTWRPRRLFSWPAIRSMLGFSAGIMGGNSLNYWIRNADNLLIGKVLGAVPLGLYSRAYMVMLLPIRQINAVLSRVMFSALSSIQSDRARARRIYLRAIAAIALFSFPAMLGLLVVAEDFVLAIFGPKWVGMIPALRVLCLVGLMQSVNSTVGWIYNSQGRSDIQFWWILFGGVLTIIAFVIGINWGILGVSVAYAIRVFSTTWLNFYIPGRLIEMKVSDVARTLYQPLLVAIGMAALVALVGWLIPAGWPSALRLMFLVPTGVLSFAAAIHILRMPAYTDLMRLARERASAFKHQVSHST